MAVIVDVNRPTRTQSVQDRIVSETHSSRCPVNRVPEGWHANSSPLPGFKVSAHEWERPMILSSTTRKQGQRGCAPFPCTPQSPPSRLPLRFGQSRSTIPTLTPQSPCQRRCAPTAVHLRSGMPFGFPPESMFTFTGIPTIGAALFFLPNFCKELPRFGAQ